MFGNRRLKGCGLLSAVSASGFDQGVYTLTVLRKGISLASTLDAIPTKTPPQDARLLDMSSRRGPRVWLRPRGMPHQLLIMVYPLPPSPARHLRKTRGCSNEQQAGAIPCGLGTSPACGLGTSPDPEWRTDQGVYLNRYPFEQRPHIPSLTSPRLPILVPTPSRSKWKPNMCAVAAHYYGFAIALPAVCTKKHVSILPDFPHPTPQPRVTLPKFTKEIPPHHHLEPFIRHAIPAPDRLLPADG